MIKSILSKYRHLFLLAFSFTFFLFTANLSNAPATSPTAPPGCYTCAAGCIDQPYGSTGWTGCENYAGECFLQGNQWECQRPYPGSE